MKRRMEAGEAKADRKRRKHKYAGDDPELGRSVQADEPRYSSTTRTADPTQVAEAAAKGHTQSDDGDGKTASARPDHVPRSALGPKTAAVPDTPAQPQQQQPGPATAPVQVVRCPARHSL